MHQKCNKTWTGDCFLEIFEEIKAQNLNLTTLKQILASFEAYLNQILKKILLLFLSFLLLLSQQKKFHCCHVATKFYTTKWTCLAHTYVQNNYKFAKYEEHEKSVGDDGILLRLQILGQFMTLFIEHCSLLRRSLNIPTGFYNS